jgi:hypothetical protein
MNNCANLYYFKWRLKMSNEHIWNYSNLQDGVIERNIYIKSKKVGRPLRIAHLTDPHFNYCNQKDIEENDPILMSTLENRKWLKSGSSVENAVKTLSHAKNADAIVITGDILDYLSYGCEELAKKYIFEPYPNLIAARGNHEAARKVQGKIAETMPFEEKEKRLKALWCNDISYSSTVIDERVMIIQMDNCSRKIGFYENQIEPFKNDIEKARENGYIALLFFHVNIATDNENDEQVFANRIGDSSCKEMNLSKDGISEKNGDASKEICDIIRNSADVIMGCFCGHLHCDLYSEISAKTKSGESQTIPQYILIGTPYGKGHLLNIEIL